VIYRPPTHEADHAVKFTPDLGKPTVPPFGADLDSVVYPAETILIWLI